MGYEIKKNKRINPRTARKAYDEGGVKYVIVEGAPRHYISGFGVVGPGDVVTLPAGDKPGQHLRAVADADVAKVDADPAKAAELASAAAKANEADAAKDAKGDPKK